MHTLEIRQLPGLASAGVAYRAGATRPAPRLALSFLTQYRPQLSPRIDARDISKDAVAPEIFKNL
jgi:hypothetical protein